MMKVEILARLTEMRHWLGKLPHESLSVEDVEKGLKHLESINSKKDADVLRKVYGVEKLSELSKYHY